MNFHSREKQTKKAEQQLTTTTTKKKGKSIRQKISHLALVSLVFSRFPSSYKKNGRRRGG
jgi:hypothetical protein